MVITMSKNEFCDYITDNMYNMLQKINEVQLYINCNNDDREDSQMKLHYFINELEDMVYAQLNSTTIFEKEN